MMLDRSQFMLSNSDTSATSFVMGSTLPLLIASLLYQENKNVLLILSHVAFSYWGKKG